MASTAGVALEAQLLVRAPPPRHHAPLPPQLRRATQRFVPRSGEREGDAQHALSQLPAAVHACRGWACLNGSHRLTQVAAPRSLLQLSGPCLAALQPSASGGHQGSTPARSSVPASPVRRMHK